MKLVQLTPGAGNMYCGNCLRDNALVAELRRQGHDVCMVPLYLPLTLDEEDRSRNVPVFFGGINIYLEQKLPFYRLVPGFLRRLLDSRSLLRTVGSRAASTLPSRVGDLTVSMLRGEQGNQARELDELTCWLKKEHRPDVVSFSNALLLGMHARIKSETGARTVCLLTGEDAFLDNLTEPWKTEAWTLVRRHAAEVDLLIAPSRYFADFMQRRLELPPGRIRVVPPGIHLEGFEKPASPPETPTLGFFARLNRGKGLDILVDAFIEVRKRERFPTLKLKIGGGLSPWNEPFLDGLKRRIAEAGLWNDVSFHPNVDRREKIEFLRSLTLFSVPSRLNEAFGLYVLESQGAGVPGLFPNVGAFPEIVSETNGGVLFEPKNPMSLADAVEELLADPEQCRRLAASGRTAVFDRYSIDVTSRRFAEAVSEAF